jgi:hypothetical protein
MTMKATRAALDRALLRDGEMKIALYQYELEELIDELITSMQQDNDQFIFAVTEHTNDVAMALIEPSGQIYVNEEARARLQQIWPVTYKSNMKKLIPLFTRQLSRNEIPINGVKMIARQ